ncbi:MAG: hypothetical protein SFU98_01195 [Leptospiraceae bacterium]|nr:hypothetical protein [Leptospiraceae bacterium]
MNRVFKVFLILLSSVIFLEVFLRIIKPKAFEFYFLQKQFHKLDKDYIVDLEPNVDVIVKHFLGTFQMKFSTNSLGFRASRELQANQKKILCIGDSVTMGFGVNDEDTFCKKLDGFQNSKGEIYQTLNLGVDAYGPTNVYHKLKKYIPILKPELIYYFPSTGDDVDEIVQEQKNKSPLKKKLFEIQFQLSKYSYSFLALKIFSEQIQFRFKETFIYPFIRTMNELDCLKGDKTSDCRVNPYSDLFNSFKEDFFVPEKGIPANEKFPVFSEKECEENKTEFKIPEIAIASMDKIRELGQKEKIKIVYFLAPIDIETAYCSSKEKKIHRYYKYLEVLKKYLESNQEDYIDLNQYTHEMIFGKENSFNPRPYYILGDGHYTKLGNEWVYKHLLQKTNEVLKD